MKPYSGNLPSIQARTATIKNKFTKPINTWWEYVKDGSRTLVSGQNLFDKTYNLVKRGNKVKAFYNFNLSFNPTRGQDTAIVRQDYPYVIFGAFITYESPTDGSTTVVTKSNTVYFPGQNNIRYMTSCNKEIAYILPVYLDTANTTNGVTRYIKSVRFTMSLAGFQNDSWNLEDNPDAIYSVGVYEYPFASDFYSFVKGTHAR